MNNPNAKDDGSNIQNDDTDIETKNQDQENDQDQGSEGADDEEELTPENFKKYKDLSHNYKIRAEKAESKLKGNDKEESKKQTFNKSKSADDFSTKDMYSLIKADVPEEDFERVGNYAKLNKLSIAEALKDEDLQLILNRQAEKRATAKATITGQRRAGSQQVSDQKLLENASKGIIPQNEDDIERLAKARIEERKAGK
jgi:hypothetical protein